jgi:glyoxylase-like metal-dependent hydrolase (beta-lactamase superfamily II)
MIDEIGADLFCIEVPLPGSPLQSINSYVVTSDDRSLVIDTGMMRPECERALREGLDELNVRLAETDFFITHLHADHMGLVSTLATDTSTVYFNRPDNAVVVAAREDSRNFFDTLIALTRRGGFSEREIEASLREHPGYKYSPPDYPPFRFVDDGDELVVGEYRFLVVATPGHTPGHRCLYEPGRRLFVSGDHVLGDITPNITVWADDDDSLGDYLASLDKVAELDVELVLPGHRTSFNGFRSRIDELKRHHRHRLDETLAALDSGSRTAYQVASRMTWDIVARSWDDFPVVQKWFAVSEATSHLRYLQHRDQVVSAEHDGRLLYGLK